MNWLGEKWWRWWCRGLSLTECNPKCIKCVNQRLFWHCTIIQTADNTTSIVGLAVLLLLWICVLKAEEDIIGLKPVEYTYKVSLTPKVRKKAKKQHFRLNLSNKHRKCWCTCWCFLGPTSDFVTVDSAFLFSPRWLK